MTVFHPTEVYRTYPGFTVSTDDFLPSIPTCLRPPLGALFSGFVYLPSTLYLYTEANQWNSDRDGIPDREETGPNLTMVEGTPPVILDKKGRDKSSEKYSGPYLKTWVKADVEFSFSGVAVRGKIVVVFTLVDNAGLDKVVIYVQTGGERVIHLGGVKRAEIEEEFEIGDLLRLIHGGFDVKVNATDLGGNWATGETHIDSALQTLKKGLSALLDMIVAALKVIAKVASMLLDVIKKIILNMLEPILKPLKDVIRSYAQNVLVALKESWIKYAKDGIVDSSIILQCMFYDYKMFFIGLIALLTAISIISTIMLGGGAIIAFKPLILGTIFSSLGLAMKKELPFEVKIDGLPSMRTILEYAINKVKKYSIKMSALLGVSLDIEYRSGDVTEETKTNLTNVWFLTIFFNILSLLLCAIGLGGLDMTGKIYAAAGLILSLISTFLIIGASLSLLTNTYDEFSFRLFSAILAIVGLIYSLLGLSFTDPSMWVLPVIGIPVAVFSLIIALLL